MTKHEHEAQETAETPGSTKAAAKDALTSGIPPGYVPDPYPGWRWNDKTGASIIVTSPEDDIEKRAEGYTDRKPPPLESAPPTGTPTIGGPASPAPNHDLPPYRRPRQHDGD